MVLKHLHALYDVSAIYTNFCKNISKFVFILLILLFYHFCSIFTNILFVKSAILTETFSSPFWVPRTSSTVDLARDYQIIADA